MVLKLIYSKERGKCTPSDMTLLLGWLVHAFKIGLA
jgi:hypothetical protein